MTVDDLINGIIKREGPYVNNPDDPGGETCWGVTVATARAAGYTGAMSELPQARAFSILKQVYYSDPHFDWVYALAPSLATHLTDCGVNQSVARAGTHLQRALNAMNAQGKNYPDIAADGHIGPGTITALTAFMKARGAAGEAVLVKAITCLQGARYIELGEANPRLETFEFGWFANRIGFENAKP